MKGSSQAQQAIGIRDTVSKLKSKVFKKYFSVHLSRNSVCIYKKHVWLYFYFIDYFICIIHNILKLAF